MPKKDIFIISPNRKNVNNMRVCKEYIGKKVFSSSGSLVGVVDDIAISSKSLAGIYVKSKKYLFVDKNYFNLTDSNNIILKIDPLVLVYEKVVFDNDGRRLGKVIDVFRSATGNDFEYILVRKGFSKPIKVMKSQIDVLRENIILNTSFEDEK